MIVKLNVNVPKDAPKDVRIKNILIEIGSNNKITINELSKLFDVDVKTIKRDIEILKQQKKIERAGGRKEGYWKIL